MLHALQDGVSGGNGVYVYTASSAFPTQTFSSTNYWVDVVFDTEVAPVLVPDVVNQTQAAAEAAIVAATLTVGNVTTAQSDTVPAGSVISQNPAGGASVLPGTAVDLVVSLGASPVLVPDVVGLEQAAAESAITGLGLVVGAVTTAQSVYGSGGQRDQPGPDRRHAGGAGRGGGAGGLEWAGAVSVQYLGCVGGAGCG